MEQLISLGTYEVTNGLLAIDSIRKHGFFGCTFGTLRTVAFFRADTIAALMGSHASITKGEQFKFLRPWLGRGLIISEGEHWRRHRKLFNPAFNVAMLASFVPIINDNIAIMLRRIERGANTTTAQTGSSSSPGSSVSVAELDIVPLIKDLSLDIVCETSLSTSVGAQLSTTDRKEYIEPIHRATVLFAKRLLNPLVHSDFIYSLTADGRENAAVIRQIHGFVRRLATERKATIEEQKRLLATSDKPEAEMEEEEEEGEKKEKEDKRVGSKKRKYVFVDTLLNAHLDNPQGFTERDILEEVNALMFAGQDSTSVTLTMALLLIADDRRVQARIVEELNEVFSGESDPAHCQVTIEHTRSMRYLEAVIKEALRLFSAAPNTAKRIESEITVNGHRIPAGTSALLLFSILHKDPAIFPQPEKFIPERFFEETTGNGGGNGGGGSSFPPYSFIPFSAGPRTCPGRRFTVLEMKLIIASLCRRYHLVAVTRRETVKIGISVVLTVRSPVLIRFENRH